jgi:hypothetical protein
MSYSSYAPMESSYTAVSQSMAPQEAPREAPKEMPNPPQPTK